MLVRVKKSDNYIQTILDNLRLDDEIEMFVEYGENWKKIIKDTSQIYDLDVALDKDGNPICLFGIVGIENNIGVVLLLATKEIEKKTNYITFARGAKKEITLWQKRYSILCNRVYKRNDGAINWLKWLGFKFDNPLELDESVSLFFYKGILEDENRKTIDSGALQGIKRTPLLICSQMERYSKLCCNNK
ncbi:MAG: hypothetical protein WCG95_00100 [bacterium]